MKNKPFHAMLMSFGKHRGKSIEDIPSDYLEWLMEQDWFIEKYEPIAQMVERELAYRSTWECHFYEEREE